MEIRKEIRMAILNAATHSLPASSRAFSWVTDIVQKIKDVLTLPNPPVLVPIPVRSNPRRPPPRRVR